jgi:peptidylprolyl isomerase
MAKTRDKRAAARQAERVHRTHAAALEQSAQAKSTIATRRAIQRRPQRTGFVAFVREFPVLTGIITVAIVAGLVSLTISNHWLANLGKTTPIANTLCGWATHPTVIPVPSTGPKRTYDAPPPLCITAATKGSYVATVNTTEGVFEIATDQTVAQYTTNDFIFLATHHYYDGLAVTLVTPDLLVKMGDPLSADYSANVSKFSDANTPGYTIHDEYPQTDGVFGVGAVAMSNQIDHSTNKSITNTTNSQFFICTANDLGKLLPTYNYFGNVMVGMSVVNKLKPGDKINSITVAYYPTTTPGELPSTSTPTPTSTP